MERIKKKRDLAWTTKGLFQEIKEFTESLQDKVKNKEEVGEIRTKKRWKVESVTKEFRQRKNTKIVKISQDKLDQYKSYKEHFEILLGMIGNGQLVFHPRRPDMPINMGINILGLDDDAIETVIRDKGIILKFRGNYPAFVFLTFPYEKPFSEEDWASWYEYYLECKKMGIKLRMQDIAKLLDKSVHTVKGQFEIVKHQFENK